MPVTIEGTVPTASLFVIRPAAAETTKSRADQSLRERRESYRRPRAGHGGDPGDQHVAKISDDNLATATIDELGLSSKQIHEGRMISKAETADPGVIAHIDTSLCSARVC